jgi:transcriptional regulator with XRE-family HTH domain
MEITAKQIRECREALGLSQEEFAAMLGYTSKDRRGNVSKLEVGKIKTHRSVTPRLKKLLKQAQTTQ